MREFNDGDIVPGTRYRVLRQLGAGGMGSVYLVEHTELGKQFVLKALFRELSSRKDLVGRLRQEWRALGRLCHPNIVNVTDAGTSNNGVPFYVMEHVPGETLGDLLKREHALGIPRAIHIASSVLDALSAAHEIGIVHRDVKPPNIFVSSAGGVKLLDFGIAKLADQSAEVITARGVAIGTPRYMSPEQAKGQSVDQRADLYAVGLVMFETIAGVGPFDDAKDANQLLLAHLTIPAPRLSGFHRAVTPELDDIVMSLLAKEPESRPASASHVAQALRGLLVRRPEPPSTHGVTPRAGYQATTPAVTFAAPSTKPDGIAGRSPAARESTTVNAPLSRMMAPTELGAPSFSAPVVSAPVISAPVISVVARPAAPHPPEAALPSATGATRPGLDWAKDGFDTQAIESPMPPGSPMPPVSPMPPGSPMPPVLGLSPVLPSSSTLVSPPPSGVVSERTHTLRLDPMDVPPPNDIPSPDQVETHTSVPPAAAYLMKGTTTGETPAPLMSTPTPSASAVLPARRGLSALVFAVAMLSVFAVTGLGYAGWRLLRPAPADLATTAPTVQTEAPTPVPAPAPTETAAASARPPPAPSPEPAAAPPVTSAPVAARPREPSPREPAKTAAQPKPAKPKGEPPPAPKPTSTKPKLELPASGL